MAKSKYWDKWDDYDYDDYWNKRWERSSRYGSSSSKKSYGTHNYQPKRTNWYDEYEWGSFFSYQKEDEEFDSFIADHANYDTPTSSNIQAGLNQKYTAKDKEFIKEAARFFFHQMIEEENYVHENYADPDALNEEALAIHSTKSQLYSDLWQKTIPGFSPLEKALFLFDSLQDQARNSKTGELDLNAAASMADNLRFDEDIIEDPVVKDLIDANEYVKHNKFKIFKLMSYIKNLGAEFKVEKEVEEKEVQNSKILISRRIKELEQVYRVPLYQRALPHFNLKLVTKDLFVPTPVDRTEHKQKIIILEDCSGSMDDRNKRAWTHALLLDRLKYVVKEECEIFFSYYSHNANELKFVHLFDRASAMNFWKTFSYECYAGGTDLSSMVERVKLHVDSKNFFGLNQDLSEEKPEILVIADGNDSIRNSFPYRVNAITLVDYFNEQWKKLCIETEGKYVFIDNNKIIQESKEGRVEEKLKQEL